MPVVGSSRTSTGRSPTSAAATQASRLLAAGELLQGPSRDVRETEFVEDGVALGPGLAHRQAAQPPGGLGG